MWHINCANFISFNSFQYYFLKFLTKNLKMMKNLVIFICSISLASAATTWGYDGENGPENWGGICNNGQSQSPVNIDPSQVENASNLTSLEFINYNATGHVEVENNGHGVEISGFAGWANRPMIQGGGLGARYMLSQFHFHWAHSENGSEHQFNGTHFPAEIHLIHVMEGLTVEQALQQSNGLAVVGIFYKIGSNGTSISGLEEALAQVIEEPEIAAEVANYSPAVHLPNNLDQFFRYNGSLTTPECQEAVIWTVMAKPQIMTQQQIQMFRAIHGPEGQPLATNVRPIQQLNGRIVQMRK